MERGPGVVSDQIGKPTQEPSVPLLRDMRTPRGLITPLPAEGLPNAQKRIFFYSPAEWEELIEEWATGLESDYVQIKQFGGSGDRGVDVAAFRSEKGFEGEWDLFQGKHYAKSLTPSNAYPEMLKILIHAQAEEYSLPKSYRFMAPQGCGSSLTTLLSSPSKLKTAFLAQLEPTETLGKGLSAELRAKIKAYAAGLDFSMFRSVEPLELLNVHYRTRFYAARFGTELPIRNPVGPPPDSITPPENRYVEQLLEVYREKHPASKLVSETLVQDPQVGKHFKRQRISFFQAEALRLYARDSVPDGTFERLQDDILSGVVDTAEANFVHGYDRLQAVLSLVGQLDLSTHALISRSTIQDRKGICHQLANQDDLTWMGEA